MKTSTRFIVIDDDQINNLYCKFIIKEAVENSEIKTFDIPEKGFEYIAKEYSAGEISTVLFLDINMPTWSGWDFLENFANLDENIQKQFKIFMVSSSVDPADHQRAKDNVHVVGYLEKPLSEVAVLSTMAEEKVLVY